MRTIGYSLPSAFLAAAIVGASFVGSLPAAAQSAAPAQAAPPVMEAPAGPTPRQQAWLHATPEQRVLLAEKLGDDGARALARQRGWQSVFDGAARALPQGPDQVWRSADGVIHVIEAKGGGSPLGNAYGYRQGTPEWAIRSAERVLTSPRATIVERDAARTILDAAARGRIEVHVVRTSHVLGEPTAAVLQQSLTCSDDAARLARSALESFARTATGTMDDAARAANAGTEAAGTIDDVARAGEAAVAGQATSTALRTAARVAVPVAVVVDAGFRVNEGVQIEQRFQAGEIAQEQREVEHARNVAGMAGGWGGAFVGAKLGAMGGGAAGTAVAPGPGTAIGAGAGAVAGGVAGYVGGEAAAEAAAEWAVERVHAAGTTVADLAQSAWDGTKHAAHVTAEAAGDAWDWTSDKTRSAWDSTTDGATRAWRWLTD
ncbi:MAG: hypothetical protein FLDDKLPJ_01178 [Phycisphaerae bacterium]|nr:hypothetical protein [Phycisphaerae bacterium]